MTENTEHLELYENGVKSHLDSEFLPLKFVIISSILSFQQNSKWESVSKELY